MTTITDKNHYKSLLKLGLPIIIGQLGIIILGFADTFMVGHHSTMELGAAAFVNNIFNLTIIFSTGYSYGLTPIVGKLYGRKENHKIGNILKNGLAINSIITFIVIFVMLILYFNIENLGQPDELIPIMKPYYIVLLISLIFVQLFNTFKQFADGITDTKLSMWIMLAGNTFNIIGNYALIYGMWGFPEMGLLGAGISTLLSRILMLLIFVLIFAKSGKFEEYRTGYIEGRVSKTEMSDINKLGLPVALQMGMETASFSLSAIMVGWLGTIALASHQIMLTIGQFGFMLYYGMAAAVAVKISNYHGVKDYNNIKKISGAGFHIILIMSVMVSIMVFLTKDYFGSWFTDNIEVTLLAAQLAIPFIVYQFGDGLQCNYSNALRGISDVKPVMLYAFIAYVLLSLSSGYIFGFVFNWGLIGIWFAFPLGLTSAGIMYYLRFRKQINKQNI